MDFTNSVLVGPYFSVHIRAFLSVVEKLVSEQLPQWTNVLGGQYQLSNGSESTSAMDTQISAPICTKYRLQKSVHTKLIDCDAWSSGLLDYLDN